MASIRTLVRLLFQTEGKSQMLPIGAPAPQFTVQTHEGKDLSLTDLGGKKVLLWFYPKADTPG
jgi:thioredoxin-dependent peroxiredoxin